MTKLLQKFVVVDECGNDFANIICFFENDSLCFRDDIAPQNDFSCKRYENYEKVYFRPSSCCDVLKKSGMQDKGSSGFILTDDIYQQLRSCWTVDCLLYPNEVLGNS